MSGLVIRKADPEGDAEALCGIYGYYVENTAISFEYVTPTVDEFRSRMKKTLERYPYLVAEADGEIKGYAYAGPFVGREAYNWSAEATIYVDHNDRKHGTGGALYRKLEEYLKLMGITNICACIGCPRGDDPRVTDNSMEFHAHMGYRLVGRFDGCGRKFGRWYDMVWMEKILSDHTDDKADVTWFPDLDDKNE